jgi:hypothetical protein
MNIIFSTNEFNIHQDKRKPTIFTITTNKSLNTTDLMNSLFNSIIKTNLIYKPTLLSEKNEKKTIFLKALSIETFEQFKKRHNKKNNSNKLPYNLILNIIYSLSKQIYYLLNNESKCFYKLDISNILVIDDCKFIYLSYEDLKDVKDNKIYIYRPISINIGYLSPEIKNAKSIPILVNYKTIFYSLGLLILDSITSNELDSIKDTKLYYFLKRCLYDEPEKRYLLYV